MRHKPATLDDILGSSVPSKPVKAFLHYGHKTGGHLVYVAADSYEKIRAATRRKNYGTNLCRVRA